MFPQRNIPGLSFSSPQLVVAALWLTQTPCASCLASSNAGTPGTDHWPSAMYVSADCVVASLVPADDKLSQRKTNECLLTANIWNGTVYRSALQKM